MKKLNVLSVFGGIECGRVALDKARIKVNKYYSSEIDKYAIQITNNNYPEIIHLGDCMNWRNWEVEWDSIDLIIAGSPCQGFSFAGKQLAFDDPRSSLFFVFVDILNFIKSKNIKIKFLLENVPMKKENLAIITDYMEVEPIRINSALVSAQNRDRYYWTNIEGITVPEDKNIYLKDVVLKDACNPTVCMHNLYGGFGEKEHRTFLEKSPTLRTSAGGGHIPSLLLSDKALDYMNRKVKGGRSHWDFKHHSDVNNPKSAAVVANFFKGVPYNVLKDFECIRHFHPIECERLQTLPDNYTLVLNESGKQIVSKTQRYKAIGNGWTVDVIKHIFSHL